MITQTALTDKLQRLRKIGIFQVVFTLFLRKPDDKIDIESFASDDPIGYQGRIRCPLCKWRPKKSSRWVCWDWDFSEHPDGGCGTSWNTFDTRGRCPGCGHQWQWTTCLNCHRPSLHEDWYEREEYR